MIRRFLLLILCGTLGAIPARAQHSWSVAPAVHMTTALGTMGRYMDRGAGGGLAIRRGDGPTRLRIDATWIHFGSRSVARPINGVGAPISIGSSASFFSLSGGPELSGRVGRFRFGGAAQVGVSQVLATGATNLPGDPAQVQRSNTYTTTTWTGALRASVRMRFIGRAHIALEASAVQSGRSNFLREYHLPIGVISGIYLYPTPYSPLFAGANLSVVLPLD